MTTDPPDGAGANEHLPLFNSQKPGAFYYRVSYKTRDNVIRTILYTSVHELILNLSYFDSNAEVVYVLKEDDSDFMTITVDQFKITIAKSLYTTTHDNLEILYLRLLLTNHHSPSITDRGRYRQFDFTLRKYLITLKGGIDSYLSYENRKVVFYMKYRRMSTNHLLASIIEWNDQHDIHLNHINIPSNIGNQELLEEALKLSLRKSQFRIYRYDPIPEAENDRIVPTEPAITSAMIKVINQILK